MGSQGVYLTSEHYSQRLDDKSFLVRVGLSELVYAGLEMQET